MDEITHHYDKTKASTGFLACAFVMLLGLVVWLLRAPAAAANELPEPVVAAVAGLAFALGAGLLVYWTWRIFYAARPFLIVSERGVYVDMAGYGWIGWEEIEEIEVGVFFKNPCVVLRLRKDGPFLARRTWFSRMQLWAFTRRPFARIVTTMLPVEAPALREQLAAYWSRRQTGPDTATG